MIRTYTVLQNTCSPLARSPGHHRRSSSPHRSIDYCIVQCHCATIFRNVIAIAHNRLHHQSALHVLFVCFVSYQFTRYSTAMVHLYFVDTQSSDELACWSHVSVKERSCDGPFASFPIVQYCQSLGCRRLGDYVTHGGEAAKEDVEVAEVVPF